MKSTYLIINTKCLLSFPVLARCKSPQFSVLIAFLVLSFQHIVMGQNSPESFHQGRVLLSSEKIAGNFGELRDGHLHAGIDYKTNETEGWPVLAADYGYVSRVKVSSTGYGKALYITHPGGIVTVYGHLRAFYPQLADSIEQLQKTKQQFEVEIFPDSSVFRVNAGQLIGFSGNTGSSDGPHLHFETRHEKSEKPINPELLGYSFDDTVPPVLKKLVIYSPGPFNGLYGSRRQFIEIDPTANGKIKKPVECEKEFFIGFEGYDLAGNEPNTLGIRSYRVIYEDSVIFECRIDSFSFDESRFVNSMTDIEPDSSGKHLVTLCYVETGNKLPFYTAGNGLMKTGKRKSVHVILEAVDTKNNISRIEFDVINTQKKPDRKPFPPGTLIRYDQESIIKGDNYVVKCGAKSFYEDVVLEVVSMPNPDSSSRQPVIKAGSDYLPVQEPVEISLKIADSVDFQPSKMVIVRLDSTGVLKNAGGKVKDGWITTRTRILGNFTIATDTVPPVFMNPYFSEDVYSGKLKMVIPVKPDLTGISDYRCTLDGQWVCGEYNSAKNKIEIFFNPSIQQGTPLILSIEATDGRGNKSVLNATVIYPNP